VPRRSRRQLVSPYEAVDQACRERELRQLAWTLRREWRWALAAQRAENVAGEPSEPNDQLRAVR
jgi:hypothetical protein